MDAIEHWVTRLAYWMVFMILAMPIYLPLLWLTRAVHPLPDAVRVVAIAVLLVTFVATSWLAHKAAARRGAGGAFVESIYDAVRDTRIELALLPVVGRLFAPRPK